MPSSSRRGTLAGIDTYIVKTVEWCNLNCKYCYFYNSQDTSWMERPRFMSPLIFDKVVENIRQHCIEKDISKVWIVFHGGEPTLQPLAQFDEMVQKAETLRADGIEVVYKVTTNATLLNDEWAERFARFKFNVGVSLDGPKELNDSMRVNKAGRGSYDQVVRGLELAQKYVGRGLNLGTISVLNPAIDGDAVYRHLRSLNIQNINLVLPEANYVQEPLPVRPGYGYFELMRDIFDAWIEEDNSKVNIRLFADMIRAVSGLTFASDQFGYAPVNVAVIETDGDLQPTDNFRACEDRMSDLGLNVLRNSMDDLYMDPFFSYCREQQDIIPKACKDCKFLAICGGGRVTTRFSREEGFARRTIYCNDLYRMFDHIERVLTSRGVATQYSNA
ncbi:radical SAM protein [Micrococcus sp. FDAARGOS_333]|uniref:radical SAM protein n=1 Tax=Micrococcus sp. FDAARGOS_333 TaxID=1930558 RepID=UPI000B4DF1D7|nr:radical SAM protein [Micrococcus sp. FDAARGOS_333]PNL17668.1 radical SAM protein [Micrococcus sp. FDAARGOS_333]